MEQDLDKPRKKIYINSVGVASGGGLRLLEALFHQMNEQDSYHFFLDARVQLLPPAYPNVSWEQVPNSIKSRIALEKEIRDTVTSGDILLCFNNLPPIYSNLGKTVVFLQNRNVIQPFANKEMSLRGRLKIVLFWLLFMKNSPFVDKFLVQTPTMKRILQKKNAEVVFLSPRMPKGRHLRKRPATENEFEFFYPADPYLYKNHARLIEAWVLLRESGLAPRLKLTISREQLPSRVRSLVSKHSLNVTFLSDLSYSEVFEQYVGSDALVFPSLCESFGLPLLEAKHLGLPVLASNRDFVLDTIDSSFLFDPLSPQDIAANVRLFIEQKNFSLLPKKIESENIFERIRELFT